LRYGLESRYDAQMRAALELGHDRPRLEGSLMKDLNRLFIFTVVGALFVFTILMLLIPEASSIRAEFGNELTGVLSDGEGSRSGGISFTSSEEKGYDDLRSWGIARGKAPGETPRADPGAAELLAQYNGIWLGDTTEKTIYLTFDEGYENGYTPKILDVLAENQVNAIFFITGSYLSREEALVRRMVDEGHAVGNHTVNHKSLPMIGEEEIEAETTGLDRRFYERFGKNMVFLRPPKGEYSEHSLKATSDLGYVNVFWSFAYDDWHTSRQRGWEYAYDKIVNNLHNGAILLLHAVSSDNANALDSVIKEARSRGYEFGDVFELEHIARREGK
jgi:peptidoglycan-N-acetylmuramic acid deacetylase